MHIALQLYIESALASDYTGEEINGKTANGW